ncbi:MAG: hypothetical protein FWD26_00875 [Treponema sp.]|nr:hypothetical protein [Treponema sp.]
MKRTFFCILLIICVTAIGFAEKKNCISLGGAVGNYFMMENEIEYANNTSLAGLGLSFYSLFYKNKIGVFFNFNYLFLDITKERYSYTDQLGVTFGIAFSHAFNEKLRIYCGAGPDISLFLDIYEYSYLDRLIIGLGIGGDVGLRYLFNKSVSINIGVMASFHFFGFGYYEAIPYSIYGWIRDYYLFGIKPYIGIGFNF